MRYAPLSFSGIAAHIIQYLFPLVIGTSSLVYSDAPTSSTASTRSVTFGSIFKFYLGLTKSLSFLLLKFNVQISKFQIDGLEAFVSNRKKNKELSGKTLA